MVLEASGKLLAIILRVAEDLLGCLLQLNAAVRNHATRRLNPLRDAVQHGRIDLVVIFLKVLGSDALDAKLVIR